MTGDHDDRAEHAVAASGYRVPGTSCYSAPLVQIRAALCLTPIDYDQPPPLQDLRQRPNRSRREVAQVFKL